MMIWTTTPRFVPVVVVAGVISGGLADGGDSVSVTANAPVVPVAPRSAGRSFLRLPTLEYQFRVHTHCTDDRSPESLLLNVADSRLSLAAEEIIVDGPTELRLRIPASQIAPLAVENFCVISDTGTGKAQGEAPMQMTIPAALSAQASLLCAGEDDKAMTYVSQTLDVSLLCQRAAEEESLPVVSE